MPRQPDPFARFSDLLRRAEATGIDDPNAMVLSTVGAGGGPSSRVVLLKHHDRDGFVFYTNLESRKAQEIAAHPLVSLSFFWRQLREQASIHGRAEPVEEGEADEYFATRARTSQLGAWASEQSRPLPSRAHLLARVARLEARFVGRPIPRPPHWSGFRVVPHYFEFWVGRRFRLHDRFAYELVDGAWRRSRLYP